MSIAGSEGSSAATSGRVPAGEEKGDVYVAVSRRKILRARPLSLRGYPYVIMKRIWQGARTTQ